MSVATSMRTKRSGRSHSDKFRQRFEVGVLSVPALIMFIGFVILPVFMAAYYGFYKWKGFGKPNVNGQFVGLDNYRIILTDPNFQQALGHTLFIAVMSLIIQGPLAILFALLLNQKFKGRGLIRTLIFVPYVVSEVIIGTGWSLMLQPNGAVNAVMKNLGLQGVDWIADPKIAIWTLMFIISWKYIGFAVILMIAGMQAIPEELYEAARVDGAGFWRQQWSITLPLLAPTIRMWAFMSIIGSLQLFDLVYIIWGQYVSSTAGTSTMATYMVREGRLANNYGYGSAVAVVIFIISLVIALTYQRFVLNRDLAGAVEKRERKQLERRMKKREREQMEHDEIENAIAPKNASMEVAVS
ncbi:sugar ABC transporter permease [Bifidobacterium pseudolongum subsp. pseudolongum]|uniref:Sugar ABC transporter permease n=1 Tax=Bifidobacterium pseudolongum subsp. pseudolongum TaxID=31954 RepID=A0A4Q5AB25_9BIFI|nr:sugar ABC transporter permease [Bifidobacterium pseudolongum]RYQ22058.1 sugar ABC transporter permease [Bifidobacterium pseudolongum subsp. pseudolongum]